MIFFYDKNDVGDKQSPIAFAVSGHTWHISCVALYVIPQGYGEFYVNPRKQLL